MLDAVDMTLLAEKLEQHQAGLSQVEDIIHNMNNELSSVHSHHKKQDTVREKQSSLANGKSKAFL